MKKFILVKKGNKIYLHDINITEDSKLRLFQFRINHRILTTNT